MSPKRKKPRRFEKVKAVKEMARERVGSPRPGQVIPATREKRSQEKHKSTLARLLGEGQE